MKRRLIGKLVIHALIILIIARPAFASSDYDSVNASLLENHILPGYVNLAEESELFDQLVISFCIGSDTSNLDDLKEQYHNLIEAWMRIQHIQFGPIELFLRYQRFYFWPQAQGKVADAIQEVIERNDESVFLPENFSQVNVGIQGLLATEALLFGDFKLSDGPKECRFLSSVALNMRNMASNVLYEWQIGESAYSNFVLQPDSEGSIYKSHQEVTRDLFKALHDGLQFIAEVKLKPVIGESIDRVRPYYAESRLSARSIQNIIGNLQALQSLYQNEKGKGLSYLTRQASPKLDQLLVKAFNITVESASSIEFTVEGAAEDSTQRPKIEKLLLQVQALKQIVGTRLAKALNFPVGFNSLDGD